MLCVCVANSEYTRSSVLYGGVEHNMLRFQ